jgi:hypothetical protein
MCAGTYTLYQAVLLGPLEGLLAKGPTGVQGHDGGKVLQFFVLLGRNLGSML